MKIPIRYTFILWNFFAEIHYNRALKQIQFSIGKRFKEFKNKWIEFRIENWVKL